MTDQRQPCPRCGKPVDRVQNCLLGAWIAYPCNCWLTKRRPS